MRRVITYFAIITLLLNLGTIQVSAIGKQSHIDDETVTGNIIVELALFYDGEQHIKKYKVPVVKNRKEKVITKNYAIGGWEFTGGCPNEIGCKGVFVVLADFIDDGKTLVGFSLVSEDKKKCSSNKEFTLINGEPTKFHLKCGIKIIVYYDK